MLSKILILFLLLLNNPDHQVDLILIVCLECLTLSSGAASIAGLGGHYFQDFVTLQQLHFSTAKQREICLLVALLWVLPAALIGLVGALLLSVPVSLPVVERSALILMSWGMVQVLWMWMLQLLHINRRGAHVQ